MQMSKARLARTWIILLFSLTVALLWFGAFFAWWNSRLPIGAVAGSPPLQPDLGGAVGVNLNPQSVGSENLEARLRWLADSGITWVRVPLHWDQVEFQPGEYSWESADRFFSILRQYPQLRVLLVLDRSPAWARSDVDASNPLAPPERHAAFGRFAAAVSRRYGAALQYYQIWDEPNIAPHWGERSIEPLDYLSLLREASVQIRSADSDARIVLAALAPTTETGGANLSDVSFLDAVYRHGGRQWFDVVAAQPYGFNASPFEEPDPSLLNFGRAALLREVMVRHDDWGTPIWATSFGWAAQGTAQDDAKAVADGVSEADQAEYTRQAIALARTEWAWLGALFWPDDCSAPSSEGAGGLSARFALCSSDKTRKPIWDVLEAAAHEPLALAPGDHAPNHPGLHYDPGWRVTSEAADPSADGDALHFRFYGTDLSLRVEGTRFWAYYRVFVDGEPANALPRDETGAAYLVLHDPLTEVREVQVARGLARETHEATIEAVGGWDQWALLGVLVQAYPEVSSWRFWVVAAGLATLTWAIAIGVQVRRTAARLLVSGSTAVVRGARKVDVLSPPQQFPYAAAAVCALVFALSPSSILSLMALGALGCLFLVAPWVSLPLIAASIPFWPHLRMLLRWQITHYEAFLWLAAGALAVRWVGGVLWNRAIASQRDWPWRQRLSASLSRWQRASLWTLEGMDWPVLALVGVGLAATLAAPRAAIAAAEFRPVILGGAIFYWLITRVQRTGADSEIWPLLDGLMAGMVLVSGVALWQLVTGQGRIDVEGVWRVRALYGSPNNLALVLDRTLPLGVAVSVFGTTAKLRRVLYCLGSVAMAIACVATFSKGALLLGLPTALVIVLLGGAWRARQRWPLVFLFVGAVAAAGLLAVLFQTPRFADLLNFQGGTSFIRLRLWLSSWQMVLDHPLFGVGPDNFLYEYRTRYVLPSAWEELNLSHPHNILLDLWTRLGVFGVAAGAWAVGAGIRSAWRQYLTGPAPYWPVALGVLGGLAATVTHGLIDNSLFLIDLMAIFMLFLGVVEWIRRGESSPAGTVQLMELRQKSALNTRTQ